MITPLKYKPVNWVDGMKLSSQHFVLSDQYTQDLVRDANAVQLSGFNYGLLPPFNGQGSQQIVILEKATNHFEITVRQCNAITVEGCRIDIQSSANPAEELVYNHYFSREQIDPSKDMVYHVILHVNPHERVPAGIPDPEQSPLRYPEVMKGYHISVVPAAEMAPKYSDSYQLTIGQLTQSNGIISVNNQYIPPCSAMISHPSLLRYYELFSTLINNIQLSAFKIADKTTGREGITPLGKNIRGLSEKLLDYIAQVFFRYRNFGYQQSPIYIAGYCSELAHAFFTGIKLIGTKEREDVLKYFYEWRDVTPGNFEELLARTIEMVYDHQDIFGCMALIEEFLKVLSALWEKLSTLEYIGQHKENIVVAEQQLVQQVQTKRTWSLLD